MQAEDTSCQNRSRHREEAHRCLGPIWPTDNDKMAIEEGVLGIIFVVSED